MNDTTNPTTAERSAPPATDPRELLAEVLATSQGVIDRLGDDQLDQPTPCTDYDVDHLVGHFACAMRRIANAGNATPIPEWDSDERPLPSAERSAQWAAMRAAGLAAWSDPAKLERDTELPWATVPGAAAIGMYVSEVICHSWDLAVATGQQVEFSDDAVGFASWVMTQALPGEGRAEDLGADIERMVAEGAEYDRGLPFQDPVDVRPDATPLERLLAWTGRDPSWSA